MKKIVYPPFALVSIALISTALNIVFFSKRLLATHILYLTGILAFSVFFFYIIVLKYCVSPQSYLKKENITYKKYLLKFYKCLSFVGLAIALYLFITRGILPGGPILFNLRYENIYGNSSNYGVSHLSLFALFLSIKYSTEKNWKSSVGFFLIFSCTSILLVERTSLLMGLSAVIYASIKYETLKKRHLVFSILTLILLFSFMAFHTNKLTFEGTNFFLAYLSYGFTAFERHILTITPTGDMLPILGIIGRTLKAIFSIQSTPIRLVSLASNDFNVFTYLAIPYIWLGPLGVITSMSTLGVIYAVLQINEKRHPAIFFANCTLLFPLILIFFDWGFSYTTPVYMFIIAKLVIKKRGAHSEHKKARHYYRELECRKAAQRMPSINYHSTEN